MDGRLVNFLLVAGLYGLVLGTLWVLNRMGPISAIFGGSADGEGTDLRFRAAGVLAGFGILIVLALVTYRWVD